MTPDGWSISEKSPKNAPSSNPSSTNAWAGKQAKSARPRSKERNARTVSTSSSLETDERADRLPYVAQIVGRLQQIHGAYRTLSLQCSACAAFLRRHSGEIRADPELAQHRRPGPDRAGGVRRALAGHPLYRLAVVPRGGPRAGIPAHPLGPRHARWRRVPAGARRALPEPAISRSGRSSAARSRSSRPRGRARSRSTRACSGRSCTRRVGRCRAPVRACSRRELETWLLFFHAEPFGTSDPLLGRDVAFYVFPLPFLEFVQNLLLATRRGGRRRGGRGARGGAEPGA